MSWYCQKTDLILENRLDPDPIVKKTRSVSSDVPEMLVILFGVSWMSDTAAALQDADHDKKIEERLLSENQTLDEFFLNIYNFLNGDM